MFTEHSKTKVLEWNDLLGHNFPEQDTRSHRPRRSGGCVGNDVHPLNMTATEEQVYAYDIQRLSFHPSVAGVCVSVWSALC